MKHVNTVTKIIAKILEVCHWVATGFMVAIAICSQAAPQWLGHLMNPDTIPEGTVSIYGFEVVLTDAAGELSTKALLLAAISGFLLCALVAMIFRNIYLIIRKSEGTTPFQKDNIRMVREIGIFSIAIPVIGLIMSIIARLVLGVAATESSVNLSGFIMGIIILSLTQVFAYGVELEKDVDGLL